MVREKKTLCGKYYMDVDIYYMPNNSKIKSRSRRRSTSSPKQKNLNDKRSKRYFRQLVHTNFAKSGYHLTLTYSDYNMPVDLEEAKRLVDNFIRRIKRRVNKIKGELKYIIVDELSSTGRIHHHMIIDCGLTRDEIENCWKLGRTNCDRLQPNENGLTELCAYLQKAREDKQQKKSRSTRTWRASKNLKKPVEVINDNKYNMRKLHKMLLDFDNKTMWHKLYPKWEVMEIIPDINEYTGQSLHVKLRRIV